LPGLDTPSSFDVDFRRRVCRGALVAGVFGLALTCALASRAAAIGTTATAGYMTASAPSTRSTVTLESSHESQGPAIPEPAPSAEPQAPATPEPAPSAEPQGPATPEPAPSAEPQAPATPEPAPSAEPQAPATPEPAPSAEPQGPATPEPAPSAERQEPATPEPAPRAEPEEPATPEPAPRAVPQSARIFAPSAAPQTDLATAPTATDPTSIVTQTKAASPPAARAVRRAPRRPATPSAAGPRPAAVGRLPFALPPYVDVSSLPALAPRASSPGPAAAANQPTKRRRAEGTDHERGPHSPLGPLDGTFHAASSATSGGGAAPDLSWCIIVLGLAAYRPQALRRHRVRQVARRLVGFSSLHAQPD
jgi:hypothetical protein